MINYRAGYPPEEIARIKNLAATGMTAQEIGESIGRTKNAIIGICNRAKIKLSNQRVAKLHKKAMPLPKENRIRLKKFFMPIPLDTVIINQSTSFFHKRHNQCAWIIGEPVNLKCCGKSIIKDRPYCHEHCKISYVPLTQRIIG